MLENLVFKVTSTNETIYSPELLLAANPKQITISNFGTEDITGLGLYIGPATTLGDVDYPADYPPETDYQDLIRWGEDTVEGITVTGGARVTLPQNSGGSTTSWITRTQGSTRTNKLPMADIAAGASVVITFEMTTPPSVTARRLYINLLVDTDI